MFHFRRPAMIEARGKVVIVTGGTKGVGRGVAERFLDAGAKVVVCGRSLPEQPVRSKDGKVEAVAVAADVRDVEGVDRVVAQTIETYGAIDVLVNNAGGSPSADAATVSPRFSASIIQLNLVAPLVFAQKANAVMQRQT